VALAQALNETLEALNTSMSSEAEKISVDDTAIDFADRFLDFVDRGHFSALVGSPESPAPLIRLSSNLYWHRYWFAAHTIANGLRARTSLPPPATADVLAPLLRAILKDAPLRKSDGTPLTLENAQSDALSLSLSSSVFILAGGPGTGKTTWTAAWLRAIFRLPDVSPERVRLCAPTGRAARRLEESLGAALAGCIDDPRDATAASLKVTTLHSLLGWRTFDAQFARGADDPLDADWVLLDEASMADVFLLSALIKALKPGTRLVLAGDPGQLPAVEAGAVLGELLPEREGAPPPLPSITLDVSHRATGDVIPLSSALRRGEGDTVIHLLGLPVSATEAYSMRADVARIDPPSTSTEMAASVRATLHAYSTATFDAHIPSGQHTYSNLLTRFRTATHEQENALLSDLWKLAGRARVLTPLRRGPISAEGANRILRERLEPQWRLDRDTVGIGFHGAPILVTRNDARTGLSNGDIGLWLESAEGALVFFPRPELPGGWLRLPIALLPSCEPGFATTVHKSQGSECDEVLILLPEAGNRLLARETLYTAITRARKVVRVFGSEEAIRQAVGRSLRRPGGLRDLILNARPDQG
jgi:exodeoxyribonuclease V alpha subunit